MKIDLIDGDLWKEIINIETKCYTNVKWASFSNDEDEEQYTVNHLLILSI